MKYNWGSFEWADIEDQIDRQRIRNKLIAGLPEPLFMKDGTYVVRIVSNPFRFLVHWVNRSAPSISTTAPRMVLRREYCSDVDCLTCKDKSLPQQERIPKEVWSCFILYEDELRSLQFSSKRMFRTLVDVVKQLDDFKQYEIQIDRGRWDQGPPPMFPSYQIKIGQQKKIDLSRITEQIEKLSVPMKLLIGSQKFKDDTLTDWLETERVLGRSW